MVFEDKDISRRIIVIVIKALDVLVDQILASCFLLKQCDPGLGAEFLCMAWPGVSRACSDNLFYHSRWLRVCIVTRHPSLDRPKRGLVSGPNPSCGDPDPFNRGSDMVQSCLGQLGASAQATTLVSAACNCIIKTGKVHSLTSSDSQYV